MVEQDKRRLADRDKQRLADQDPAIQAGMAAEIERLRNELSEAREQLAATSEVLAVIARSASDLEGVLEAVVESARKLCGADAGHVLLVDGDRYRLWYGSRTGGGDPGVIAHKPPLFGPGKPRRAGGAGPRGTPATPQLPGPDEGRAG